MQTQDIIYQQSPQFLPKIAIKLENLLASLYEAKQELHPIIHHYALKNLIKILKIIDKPELKSRLTQEFLRLNYLLPKSLEETAPNILSQFAQKTQELQTQTSRFGAKLYHDNFLQTLRLRTNDQWQECELQPPYLFNWLHQKPHIRQQNIQEWINELSDFTNLIQLYLSTLRSLVTYETIEIKHSFYQQPIVSTPSTQLIIIKLPIEMPIIPKIQFSTHALSIHFNDLNHVDQPASCSFSMKLGMVKI